MSASFPLLLLMAFPAAAQEAMDYACPYAAEDLKLWADRQAKQYRLRGGRNFRKDISAFNPDGTVNAVIEIPAGCTDKWEVNKDGDLEWDRQSGDVRFVSYLPYPGNYGMVPGTLGGDGDPSDVLVLGRALPRGLVAPVRLIGVLKMVDSGEQDDKLIAVRADKAPDNPFYKVRSFADLPDGTMEIVGLWFQNYKGRDKRGDPLVEPQGYGDAEEAVRILGKDVRRFEKKAAKD